MRVRFNDNYSDSIGSFRKGWEHVVPDDLGKQLIKSGTAVAVEEKPAEVPPAGDAAAQAAKPLTAKEKKAAAAAKAAAAKAAADAKPADVPPTDAPQA